MLAHRLQFAVLACGAGAFLFGALAQAAVVRQVPEQKTFTTWPNLQYTTYLYAPKPAGGTERSSGSPVIFYSGEWGWMPMQQEAASYLAAKGRLVLGLDSPSYFTKLLPAEDLTTDLGKFRGFVNERTGRARNAGVILVGFAAGAEIIPYLVNETTPAGVRGIVLIAPDRKGTRVFRVAIQLKMATPPGEGFDVADELGRMAPLPVVLLEGALDKGSEAKTLSGFVRGPHKYAQIAGGDHQFHDVRDTFFALLDDALRYIDDTPIPDSKPSTPAPAQGAPPEPGAPRAPGAPPPR